MNQAFRDGVLTSRATKGDVRPLWKPHLVVPAARSGENLDLSQESFHG